MKRILKRRVWLAGASLLAIVLGSGDANAVVFQVPGSFQYLVPSTGWYDLRVAGAQGGSDGSPDGGAAGALVGGQLFLAAGETLDIVVGGEEGGQTLGGNGSGGGGSFVDPGSLLSAAGGGGGAGFLGPSGSPGIGSGGHPAGPVSYGGAGGAGIPLYYPFSGYVPGLPAESGSFPNGGQGAQACFASSGNCFTVAPMGGYGGGGGGGYQGGGGGGGAPGGGLRPFYAEGEGGYSYVSKTARDQFGITGGNPGANGYVSIEFVGSSVPELSTWAMMLAGFSGLGGMVLRRGRKGITPT